MHGMYVWFEDAETRQYIEDCYIPGSKVQIEQTSNIDYAKEKEARVIARTKPKYNDHGK